jgi:hypothetical protein
VERPRRYFPIRGNPGKVHVAHQPGTLVDIFVSYASEQRTLAEEIALALRAEGHQAFFDRTELADGDAYRV